MRPVDRTFWFLLVLGIALRCIALNHPLVDHGLLRQVQTAEATKSLIEQPGFPISSRIPWAGDLDERFVLELPLYNYLVIGVFKLTGQLDLSGKLVSIILWGCSFAILQGIWRRCLKPQQVFWANLLFTIAPLGVFYSQAFMPESLVQLLAFGFILLLLRHDENPTLARWVLCAAVGLLALLIKLPEVAHLYLLLAFLVFRREGWRALARPHYWIAAAITVVTVKLWSGYMDSINLQYLPEWGSKENLRLFIGTLGERLHPRPWVMILFYLGALVTPGLTAAAAAYGFWTLLRREPQRILLVWLCALGAFYLLWFGNTAAKQGYYNIVALAPLSALFGIGTARLLTWTPLARRPPIGAVAIAVLAVACAAPGLRYLFTPDQRLLSAARWTRQHTSPGQVILFRPNHRWYMIDYPYNATLGYYADRPTFVWTRNMPERYRRAALARAQYAIVTLRGPESRNWLLQMLSRFRGLDKIQPEPVDWLPANGFRLLNEQDDFAVYSRNQTGTAE